MCNRLSNFISLKYSLIIHVQDREITPSFGFLVVFIRLHLGADLMLFIAALWS